MADVTLAELQKIGWAIDAIVTHPDRMYVLPGCDCGCGGDITDWDAADAARDEAIALLKRYGLEVLDG